MVLGDGAEGGGGRHAYTLSFTVLMMMVEGVLGDDAAAAAAGFSC